jgi:outer membrane receptor protein involved in Fe transport
MRVNLHRPCFVQLLGTAIVLLLMGTTLLKSQTTTAVISGTVTDTSGAAIPGAKIEVKNVATGISESTTSDNQGRYRVPELLVGDYEVEATQTGFQTVLRKGITLTVGNEAVIDFSLLVGQSQQTVTVDAQASQVETTSTAVSTLVDRTQMEDLPLNGRNFEQLMTLAAGVITIPNTGGGFYGKQDNYSIAGSRPLGQQIIIDDTNFMGFWGHATGSGATGSSLGVEAIAEFQTLTNTYSSQFGGNGGVVNAVSKSGTNAIHGSAYEFFRNSALDSRSPFDTIILPGNTTANPPEFRRNQFGGGIGGPIKKDKIFFFVNYEGIRAYQGQSQIIQNVPDANAHQGYLPCGIAPTYSCNASTNLAFVGVPASIAPIMALFPTASAVSPTGVGNLTVVGNNITNENYVLGRIDYTISSKDNIFIRAVRDNATYVTPFSGMGTAGVVLELDTTDNYFATIEERHIFSPNLVNLARFSFMRPTETEVQDSPQIPSLVFTPSQPDGRVTIGSGPAGTTVGISSMLPNFMVPNHFVEGDDVIWTHGAHSIRAGIGLERVDDNETSPANLGGTYSFASVLTFLQATPSTVTIPIPGNLDATRALRTWMLTPYIQDEWKVNRNLTLNLGLRYEWNSNPTEANNLLHNVTQFTPSGELAGTNFNPVSTVFQSNPTDKNFAPRIGVAYSPFADHKTSIRAGFGMFYQLLQAKDVLPGYWDITPFVLGTGTNPSFPNPFIGSGPAVPLPSEAQGLYYGSGIRTPVDIQYNFNIQRDISKGMILTVGYTGSRGEHLMLGRDFNTPELINGEWGLLAGTVNPATGAVVAGPAGTTTPNVRYNPNFASVVMHNTVGNSNYNGLIASLSRRFAQHWQTQVSYTYSKSMDDGSAGQGAEAGPNAANYISNPYNAATEYGLSSFNRTQALRISGIYELPGRGMLLGGWRLTGIYTRTTGAPIDIMDGFDRSGLGMGADARPNVNPSFTGPVVLGGPNEYFNPAAFSLQAPGTLGNVGRDTIIGPGLSNLDTALLKNIPVKKISEVANLQFRAEFFNLPNHPNWAQPGNSIYLNGVGSGTINPNVGKATAIIGTSRQIQFGLRIAF